MGKLLVISILTAILFLGGIALSAYEGRTDIITGLEMLTVISQEEASAFPVASGRVEISISGHPLPYDKASNTYFIPQSDETNVFEGRVQLATEEGLTYYLVPGGDCTKKEAMDRSIGYTVYGINGEICISSKVIFTSLPVIRLTTPDTNLPGEEDASGTMQLFALEEGRITRTEAPVNLNLRGNTSKRFPKRSYRMEILDGSGGKQDISIAGLRSDDDWILNPLYTDTSKIREKLAYDLWNGINSSGKNARSSRMEYIEVFFGDNYWGLYALQERIDNKQVDGDKRADILYKVATMDQPTAEDLLNCANPTLCAAFEIQNWDTYNGTQQQRWIPAATYMAALSGDMMDDSCTINLENAVDYGLWAMLTQAHDCHFKNQFLNCVYGDGIYTLYKIPWDLNHTFGDVWRNALDDSNYSEYFIGELVMDDLFARMTASGDSRIITAIQDRWLYLRTHGLTQEAIIEYAESLYASLAGPLSRDSIRWPEGGMGNGNAMNILDIEDYIIDVLPRIDSFVQSLGNQEGQV